MRFAVSLVALCASLTLAASAQADLVREFQPGAITLSDAGGTPPVAGSPSPSSISVAGVTGRVTGVSVKLEDVEHTFPDDIDLMLVGPNGARVILMADAGSTNDISGVDLTFEDAATTSLPDTAQLTTGTYRPTNHAGPDAFPGGAAPPYGASLGEAFDGADPNGPWQLYSADDGASDAGKIAGGWSLTLRLGTRAAYFSPIVINDGTPPAAASPYPAPIEISGLYGAVEKVTVGLRGLSHADPGDVDVMLQAPNGGLTSTLMSDAGGLTDVSNVELHFSDDAPGGLSESGPLTSGSFKPTNHQGGDAFPSPAANQGGTSLGVFKGINPNGNWRLWVVDDASGSSGKLAEGWVLHIEMKSGVRVQTASLPSSEGDGTKTLVVERPEGGDAAKVHYELPGPFHGKDVQAKSGDLTFALGQKTRTLPVTIFDDAGDEPLEYVPVKLTAVSGDVRTDPEGDFDYLQLADNDVSDVGDDFNGDGRADQAIGIPKEDLNAGVDAGSVQVLYGSADGLTGANDLKLTQDTAGMPDVAEPGDGFGAAVAASDFNGDGFGDLAIGAPGEDDAGITDMGRVFVVYGSASGLTTAGAQLFGQGTTGIPDDNEAGDRFGAALAAGNLGRGARGDLAIGQPGEDLGALNGAGAVTALYGAASGLGVTGAALWHQDVANVEQVAEAGDAFGSVLVIGDFGWGAERDLAVGVPAENNGAGVVQVLYGSTVTGLAAAGDKLFGQGTPAIAQGVAPEAGDGFGAALAAGQLGDTGTAEDLAIGVPGEDENGVADTGLVHALRGHHGNGLTLAGVDFFTQADSDINTGNGAGDRFGAALAIGDFGGSGAFKARGLKEGVAVGNDLAIGVPGESFGALDDVGAVHLVYGQTIGVPGTASNKQWHQNDPEVIDDNEAGDQFGAALAGGVYTGMGTESLAVGVPGEKLGAANGAGGVAVLPSNSFSGLTGFGSQRWAQGAGGVQDAAEPGDAFGGVMAP